MIAFENVTKQFVRGRATVEVLRDATVTFDDKVNIGILGPRGSGKSTLIKLLAKRMAPDRGRVTHHGTVSWPLATKNLFLQTLTLRTNLRIVAELYGAWPPSVIRKVDEIAELGPYLDRTVRDVPRDIHTKTMYSLCLALGFDCYLADEALFIGDAAFRHKAEIYLQKFRYRHSFVIATRHIGIVRQYCDIVYLLHGGLLRRYDDPRKAIQDYKEL